MRFQSTKTYGHERGLSCCFRQWKAESHCHLLHGYALAITLTFEADELDHRRWVVDFGAMQPVEAFLRATFDHTVVADRDDPQLPMLQALHDAHLGDLVVLDGVGCESFAKHISSWVTGWTKREGYWPRVNLVSVEVREHGANSARCLEVGEWLTR